MADDDLDAYVTEMLLKEAREREAKYGKEGLKAYFSDEEQEGPKHKTNKRFLASMIKSVDGHNQALLRGESDDGLKRKDRTTGPASSGSRLFALAKSNMGTTVKPPEASTSSRTSARLVDKDRSRSSHRQDDEPHRSRDADRHKRDRSNSPERRETHSKRHHTESHHRRKRGRSEESEDDRRSRPRRSSHRHPSEDRLSEEKDGHSGARRSSRRRGDENPVSEDDGYYSRKRLSRRRRENESALEDYERSKSERSSHRHCSSRRSRERESPDDEDRKRSSRRRKEPDSTPHRGKSDEPLPAATEPSLAKAPEEVRPGIPRVQPPSRSPTPPSRENDDFRVGAQPSKMDKYFQKAYDPRLDVSVADLTDPVTGYIAEGNFDQWSQMIETLKIRKAEKGFREREREMVKELAKEAEREERRKRKEAKRRRKAGLPSDDEQDIGPPAFSAANGLLSATGYVRDKSKAEWNKRPDLSF